MWHKLHSLSVVMGLGGLYEGTIGIYLSVIIIYYTKWKDSKFICLSNWFSHHIYPSINGNIFETQDYVTD